jgi:hypothetical protein
MNAKIHAEILEYEHGDTVLEGFLAYDDTISGKRPGVMIAHEWTGVGSYVKRQGIVFERIFLLIFQSVYTNIKRQKPRSPDLIGTRMSEDTVPCLCAMNYK